jgi:hypothetical protein
VVKSNKKKARLEKLIGWKNADEVKLLVEREIYSCVSLVAECECLFKAQK